MSALNNAPQVNESAIDAVLQKYLENKGGDPASSSSPAPLNFRFGNEQLSVKSVEDLQREVDARMSQLAQAYQQERAQWQQQVNQTALASTPTPQVRQEVPQVKGDDPVEFVQSLVSDPKGTLEKALSERLSKIGEIETRLERQSFSMAHPFYASNPQVMSGLEKLCESRGVPVTAQNLEMAASWAAQNGYIANEEAFKEQQRQQLLAVIQGQNATQPGPNNVVQMQPQGGMNPNNYIKSPHAQYMAPLPPPSTSMNGAGSQPSRLDMAISQADKMSAEDLKRVIEGFGGNVS